MKLKIWMSKIQESLKRAAAFIVAVRFQFIKYAIAGSATFVIDYGIFFILHTLNDIFYLYASALSQISALLFNFTVQKKWTFASSGNTSKQLLRYTFLQVWNYGFSLLALFILVDIIEIQTLIAKLLTVGIIVSWNFLAYKFLVYHTN